MSVGNGIKKRLSRRRRRRLIGCSGAEIAYLVVMGCIKVGRSLTHIQKSSGGGGGVWAFLLKAEDEGQRVETGRWL